MKLRSRFAVLSAMLALAPVLAVSQTTTFGTVSVSVEDPSGAAVPGAQLEIKDLSTNITRRATTGPTGAYSFPDLSFGVYQLSVSAKGFQTAVYSSVQVQTARQTDIHVPLKVGAPTETVTVTTESVPLTDPDTSVLSSTIDTKQVVNLPLQGRNMFALAFLVPGWASTARPGISTAGTFEQPAGRRHRQRRFRRHSGHQQPLPQRRIHLRHFGRAAAH